MKGMVIGVILLITTQAWRASHRGDEVLPAAEPAATSMVHPSPRFEFDMPSSESSIEFARQPKAPHDPWKNRTDPDGVWHSQRQRASELLIRLDLPPLDR